MNRLIKNTAMIFGLLLVLVSCQDMDEVHQEYIEDGEIKYTSKVDSVRILPGNGRLLIKGEISGAFTVNKIKVIWDDGSNSKEFDYSKSQNQIDILDLEIDGLEEKGYEMAVVSMDADGNKSVPTTVFGRVYGENYRSQLLPRTIGDYEYNAGDGSVLLRFKNPSEVTRNTEVKFTDLQGAEVIAVLDEASSEVALENINYEMPIAYRTLYVPTAKDENGDETSIDQFPSDWSSYDIVVLDTDPEWVITDFSSEEPTGDTYASAAIDGDLSTFWHTQWNGGAPGYPHYFTFDMGIEKTIRGFETFRRQGDGRGQTKHKFHVSLDGTNWTDLGEFDVDATSDAGQTFLVSPVQARYVKYEATEGSDFFAFLAEINVIEVLNNTDWTITDFSSEEPTGDTYASAAIDGDLSTFWHTQWNGGAPGYPHYFSLDMGVEKTVRGFETFRRQGDGRGQTKHKFYVSLDGTNWTDLGEFDVDATSDAGQEFMVTPTKARYVRYEATEGSDFFAFLAELNVLGSK